MDACVYSSSQAATMEDIYIPKDISNDPTLSRTRDMICPQCGNRECVFFQNLSKKIATKMQLIYVCANTMCGHHWFQEAEEIPEEDSD
jgi:DNA-directed RNA polymerase II subunit RPB9